MTDYTQVNDYSAKDALTSGDPEKTILGSDIDAELAAIATAISSKFNTAGGAFTGAINETKGTDIASAGSIDLGAATGNYVEVTGTTTITALGTVQAGTRRVVRFTGALVLTHNATSLILPGGANITTAADDVAVFVSLGSGNWLCTNYSRADGQAIVSITPTGSIVPTTRASAPAGWLLCDGSEISATTYEALFDTMIANIANWGRMATPTFDFVDGDVSVANNTITEASHGLSNGNVIYMTNSGGALPTGLSADTKYYIVQATASDFKVSLTPGGSEVDITAAAGGGTHSVYAAFTLPDLRGRFPLGKDDMGGTPANRVTATEADNLGQSSGAEDHTLTTPNLASHSHIERYHQSAGGTGTGIARETTDRVTVTSANTGVGNDTETTGSGTAVNHMNPYQTVNYIVKT